MAKRNNTKIALSILALGGATAAVVFGSWAAWTAQTTNPGNSVSTGTLSMTNDKSPGAVITATDLAPGETGSDTVTITNDGSESLDVTLVQSGVVQEASNFLKINIDDGTNCLYPAGASPCAAYAAFDGSTGALTALDALDAGTIAPGNDVTYTIGYTLESASTDTDQDTDNTFDLTWDGVVTP